MTRSRNKLKPLLLIRLIILTFFQTTPVSNTVKINFEDLAGGHVIHSAKYSDCPNGSICFPLLKAVKAKVSVGPSVSEFITLIPDPSQVTSVNISRFGCVTTTTSVTLKKGILTNYNIKKPSEAVGCLKIPLNVVSAIIKAPIDAITGREARIAANSKLVKAQTALLAEQKKLLDAQQALIDAQSKTQSNPTPITEIENNDPPEGVGGQPNPNI